MENKRNNKKGFTLAELLIVVAIIAVLVAIAIPIFNSQLEKSRDSTSIANLRSAYAEAQTAMLTGDDVGNATINDNEVTVTGVVIKTHAANDWSDQGNDLPFNTPDDPGADDDNATVTFTYDTDNPDQTPTCDLN